MAKFTNNLVKSSKSIGNSTNKPVRGPATSYYNYKRIVEWLEIPKNFKLITGSATSSLNGVVAGAKVKKTYAYDDIADYVNKHCNTKWDRKVSMARFRAYLKKYKETKFKYDDASGGKYCLSESDWKKSITTIADKLNDDCPFYERMDRLFGDRQNITPTNVIQNGTRMFETPPFDNSTPLFGSSNTTMADLISDSDDDSSVKSDDINCYDDVDKVEESNDAENVEFVDNNVIITSTNKIVNCDPKVKSIKQNKSTKVVYSVPLEIQNKAAQSIANAIEAGESLTANKKNHYKKDFGNSFFETKKIEVELLQQKFEYEKVNNKIAIRNNFVLDLIKQGKTPAEMKEYLEFLTVE
jgi:hypothetical protein